MPLVSIGKVAELFGVHPQSVRNWSKAGKLKEERTLGGHRRYDWAEVEKARGIESPEEKSTVIYSRVSSHDQKSDLERQTEELKAHCAKEEISQVETIEDIGSGINYKDQGQQHLVSDPQEVHLVPTSIGKILHLSARQVNVLLEKGGLQKSYRDAKNRKCWKPTKKGLLFAVLKDVNKEHSNGRPVQQLMWMESVLSVLKTSPSQLEFQF